VTIRVSAAIVVVAAALGAWTAPVSAAAEVTLETKAKSSIGYPLRLGEYDKVKINVNGNGTFRSISRLCLTVHPRPDDPLAYRNTIAVTYLKVKHFLTVFNYGDPHPSHTFCDPPGGGDRFLDGREALLLWGGRGYGYDNGSATFDLITLSITGVPRSG
jgi:hypothetical protein